jgi:hypothetical protein
MPTYAVTTYLACRGDIPTPLNGEVIAKRDIVDEAACDDFCWSQDENEEEIETIVLGLR